MDKWLDGLSSLSDPKQRPLHAGDVTEHKPDYLESADIPDSP